jgi:hypothetical protein
MLYFSRWDGPDQVWYNAQDEAVRADLTAIMETLEATSRECSYKTISVMNEPDKRRLRPPNGRVSSPTNAWAARPNSVEISFIVGQRARVVRLEAQAPWAMHA